MDLAPYVYPLRKWWWLILAATITAGVSGFIATRNQEQIYVARASLFVGRAIDSPNPTDYQFSLSRELASVYADIAQRDPVRNAVKETLGLGELPDYTVSAPGTQLLEISVRDTVPERAQAVANALALQIIERSQAPLKDTLNRQAFIQDQLTSLEKDILNTEEEIETLQTRLGGLSLAVEIAAAEEQFDTLRNKLSVLQSTYARLLESTSQGAENTISIMELAEVPTVSVSPGRNLIIGLTVVVGFSLSVVTVTLIESIDSTIQTPEELNRISGLPVIATIGTLNRKTPLITLEHPHSPQAESFRLLRTGILHSPYAEEVRSLVVTSPSPREGKSTTAANLSVVLAQAGHKVILVDADLYLSSQHKIFNLPNHKGLSNLLTNSRLLKSSEYSDLLINPVCEETQVEGLYILTAGPPLPNAPDLMASRDIESIMLALQNEADFVIFDGPAILSKVDGLVLSKYAEGVILIADAKGTKRGDFKRVLERLQQIEANVLGVVLNRYSSISSAYAYYLSQPPLHMEEESKDDLHSVTDKANDRTHHELGSDREIEEGRSEETEGDVNAADPESIILIEPEAAMVVVDEVISMETYEDHITGLEEDPGETGTGDLDQEGGEIQEKIEQDIEWHSKEEQPTVQASAYRVSLEEIGLSPRVYHLLLEAGYVTPDDVIAQLDTDEKKILNIKGIGQKSLDEISRALASYPYHIGEH
jgi:capsular exopolysaccharide synthesis family protein